jgi:Fe-S oxidoreductase
MRQDQTVQIYIMGKAYQVPAGLTIMDAMEHAGYRFIRGAGCRSGFCGACSTIYRKAGEYRFEFALACQEMVEEGMHLTQLPFTPAPRASYALDEIDSSENVLLQYYPELARCVACNTCTKACPQDIEVMDYIQAALRGDIEQVADLSFDCIQCGLCAMRCPADIKHYHVGQMARRLYGAKMSPVPEHLAQRMEEIESGVWEPKIETLMSLPLDDLKERYAAREIEKETAGEGET